MALPEKERNAKTIMLIAFWICMICVVILLAEYIKRLYSKRKKEKVKFDIKSMLWKNIIYARIKIEFVE